MDFNLSSFRRPALHFSGGKDSLACLMMFKGQIDRLTVYHVNTQDQCPEIVAMVDWARGWVPNFVEITTDSKAWRQQHGMPSDIVPASSHFLGVAYGMSDLRLTNRFDCCMQNLMQPMHERMLADGVDCVIRGTKVSDAGKVPAVGKTSFYYVHLPLLHWSDSDVFEFLEAEGVPRNPIYAFTKTSAPECLSCTAWWDDGKAAYLKKHHPPQHAQYTASLLTVREALRKHLTDLDSELSA